MDAARQPQAQTQISKNISHLRRAKAWRRRKMVFLASPAHSAKTWMQNDCLKLGRKLPKTSLIPMIPTDAKVKPAQ